MIADERQLVRETLSLLLTQHARISVIGQAATGQDLLRTIRTASPDVLLVHAGIPDQSIGSLVRLARYASSRTRIMVLVERPDSPTISELSGAPGDAIITWSMSPTAMVRSLRGTRRDWPSATAPPAVGPSPALSPRQGEVITLVADGLTNIQIGSYLGISPSTVKRHLAEIYSKLGARSRVDAVNKVRLAADRAGPAEFH